MAELPEIHKFCRQMNTELTGKRIRHMHLSQQKCLNIPIDDFQARCHGEQIDGVEHKGKWFIIKLRNHDNILLSLGMGADLLYLHDTAEEAKYHIKIHFDDATGLAIRFWWFGRFLLVSDEDMPTEPNTCRIAIDPLDERFTYEYYRGLLTGKKTQIKTFLLDQSNIGGIGNMYIHDILFSARLHPLAKITDINEHQFQELYRRIQDTLTSSEAKDAFSYEKDIYGNPGGFTVDDFLVGYKENHPCPVCGHDIEKIKTGSTTSFICPACQKL